MVTKDIPIDVPLNPYAFATPEHQDFSRFPDTIEGHHREFREGLAKSHRTLGEEVFAELLDVCFSDLWVIEQCPVHNRFPDFFIPAFNLVVEIDGGYHRRGSPRHRLDGYKDWALTKRGFSVLHLDNQFVIDHCWLALEEFVTFVESLIFTLHAEGPFCPWGWVRYCAGAGVSSDGFSLSNPPDLVSIRWDIKSRYPQPQKCPVHWHVRERDDAFRREMLTLDLSALDYDCDPGTEGRFVYPRKNKSKIEEAEQDEPQQPPLAALSSTSPVV